MANATIRVQFGNPDGTGSDGHLSAEVDTRPDGLNGGRSAFNPGETAYILVYKTDNVTITDAICSAGSLSAQGSAVVTVTEELMFEDSDTATLPKPARSGLSQTVWYGRSLGGLTLQSDKITVKAQVKGVAVAKVTYDAQALVYALSSPATLNGETDFSILALIKGVAS
ncbi:hypothetical protein [Sulfurivermis fontis]|uniref:hypothetical protein n=1 Tax=Sulfurivermis fontis TaxID=1972068 RepID=UPI000FDB735F|nr:hypothetical protein [Sulfurivermis fontis]